jgi:hypothetical protein
VEEEEGEAELRRSRFILFKRTLVGASSATGAAAAVTTTATAKATTRGDLIAGLLEAVQEGGRVGAPFPTRCGEDAGTEREGAREWLGDGGAEIYSMGWRKEKTHQSSLPH